MLLVFAAIQLIIFWADTGCQVWIHCCKWWNYDLCISQGSV